MMFCFFLIVTSSKVYANYTPVEGKVVRRLGLFSQVFEKENRIAGGISFTLQGDLSAKHSLFINGKFGDFYVLEDQEFSSARAFQSFIGHRYHVSPFLGFLSMWGMTYPWEIRSSRNSGAQERSLPVLSLGLHFSIQWTQIIDRPLSLVLSASRSYLQSQKENSFTTLAIEYPLDL